MLHLFRIFSHLNIWCQTSMQVYSYFQLYQTIWLPRSCYGFFYIIFFRNVDWWLVWCLWWIWWCMSDILMIHIIVFCQYTVISCHRTDKGVRYFWCHPRDQILFCWQFDKKNFMMLVAAFLSAFSFRCILYKILE